MALFVLLLFIAYYVFLFLLLAALPAGKTRSYTDAEDIPISVIIPVRNEEQTITGLLDDLKHQQFNRFEAVVVNDHSTDKTVERVMDWMSKNQQVKVQLVNLPDTEYGKKRALTAGIGKATGELIVTTDADCRAGAGWLQSVASCFASVKTKLAAGAVHSKPRNFFGELQQLEQYALTATMAAGIRLKIPIMCNGANLAFRKSVFDEVGGYQGNEHIASGDDVFLLKKVFKKYPDGVMFNAEPTGIVATAQLETPGQLIRQRVRWAGKWRQGGGAVAGLAVFIFTFHLAFLSLPVLAMNWVVSLSTLSLLFLLKLLSEGVFLYRVSRWIGGSFNLHAFACLQFMYSPYVVFFGLTSNILKTEWKGRKI